MSSLANHCTVDHYGFDFALKCPKTKLEMHVHVQFIINQPKTIHYIFNLDDEWSFVPLVLK